MTSASHMSGNSLPSLAVLLLTKNEKKNIEKCLTLAAKVTDRIFVVDSGSDDGTVELAESLGAEVSYHPWSTYADQFNWGLDNFDFGTDWIMRLDADEEITPELIDALRQKLPGLPQQVTGISIRRQVHFMGRWIRHGGYYPTWLLRVFRNGIGRCEALWMDEHIVLSEGEVIRIHADIIDRNNKDLTFWIDKHNGYASREVLDVLSGGSGTGDAPPGCGDPAEQTIDNLPDTQAKARRWVKTNIYGHMPLFVRPLLYFLYRYFVRLGFLDGKEGLIFHFLQGFWYRFLVDAKLYEKRRALAHDKRP